MKVPTELVEAATNQVGTQIEKVSGGELPPTLQLRWEQCPVDALCSVLVRIPYRGKEADYYLKPWQAFIFATECLGLGVSPFSNEAWFNPQNNRVNLTLQGKLKVARVQGWDIGVPQFERTPTDRSKPLLAMTCKLPVWKHNEKQIMEYTAYLAEWKRSSPMWTNNPEHMLSTRAYEKALSWCGVGASELPGDQDIEPPVLALPEADHIITTPAQFVPPPNITEEE